MAKAEKKKLSGRKRDERVAAYIFVAPAVILLIAFLVVPMIYTVYFSGFKYQIMRPDAMKFIGLENYQKLFSDKNFWLALKNTVYFTVIVVPCQCVLGTRTCTSGFKEVPWSGCFPYHVLCTTAYFYGSYLRTVVCTLQCKPEHRSYQLHSGISGNEPDQVPE